MRRRRFILSAAATAAPALASRLEGNARVPGKDGSGDGNRAKDEAKDGAKAETVVQARDIDRHMRSIGTWVDWKRTCDTFKAGDPDRSVKTVLVSWMSTLRALQEARRRGCELFVTHEPTFYSHMDDDRSYDGDWSSVEKRKLLSESGMVVYRSHDVWDRVPKIGILDSWGAVLGFEGKPVAEKTFFAVHEIPETSAADFARSTAARLERFGQEAVQLVGDPVRKIRRVAIGTGAITGAREMRAMGADAAVVTEIVYWRDVRWADDMGFPLFIVSHAVSECPGVENLAKYLGEQFPTLKVEYFQEGCDFRLFTKRGPLGGS